MLHVSFTRIWDYVEKSLFSKGKNKWNLPFPMNAGEFSHQVRARDQQTEKPDIFSQIGHFHRKEPIICGSNLHIDKKPDFQELVPFDKLMRCHFCISVCLIWHQQMVRQSLNFLGLMKWLPLGTPTAKSLIFFYAIYLYRISQVVFTNQLV